MLVHALGSLYECSVVNKQAYNTMAMEDDGTANDMVGASSYYVLYTSERARA